MTELKKMFDFCSPTVTCVIVCVCVCMHDCACAIVHACMIIGIDLSVLIIEGTHYSRIQTNYSRHYAFCLCVAGILMSGLSILCMVLFLNIFLRSYMAIQVYSGHYLEIGGHYLETTPRLYSCGMHLGS